MTVIVYAVINSGLMTVNVDALAGYIDLVYLHLIDLELK